MNSFDCERLVTDTSVNHPQDNVTPIILGGSNNQCDRSFSDKTQLIPMTIQTILGFTELPLKLQGMSEGSCCQAGCSQ